MRPEGGKAVGGAGSPDGVGTDVAGSVIAAESAPCEVLDWEEACWRQPSRERGLLQSPCRPQRVRQKPKRKRCRRQKKNCRVTVADTRATNTQEGAERSSTLICGPCAQKSPKSEEEKGNPPKTTLSGRGTSPLKPTPEVGEERVQRPQARMREMPPSSTGVRMLDPLRSCSVAGSANGTGNRLFCWHCSCGTRGCSRTR